MTELYAPLITPFDAAEGLDQEGFLSNLAFYEGKPLDGYLINGSSGEAEMLSFAEQVSLLRWARSATQRRLFFGLAPSSVKVALEEIQAIRDIAVDAVLVRTPSYFGSQFDQTLFYEELASRSPLPILIYQIPQNTGVRLTGDVLRRLAEHPNIIGIKDSLGDLSMLQEAAWPAGFSYYLGAANLMLSGLRSGAVGGILALANVVPDACRHLLDLFEQQRFEEAQALQRRLIPLGTALGGSRGFGMAGLKAAVECLGLAAGPPRRPLRSVCDDQREHLRALIDDVLTQQQ